MHNFALMFDDTMEKIKIVIRTILEPAAAFFNIFSDFALGAILISVVFALLMFFCILRTEKPFSPLKDPRCFAICAMLIGANALLGYFSLNFSSYLRVGFGFATTPVAAYLFGPCIGAFVAALSDIICLIVKPTGAWLFTYTLSMGVEGMIYGLILHRRKVTFIRVFLCRLAVMVAVNIILNSIAIAPTAANGLLGIFPARIIKNLILLPIQAFIIYEVLKRAVEGRVKC